MYDSHVCAISGCKNFYCFAPMFVMTTRTARLLTATAIPCFPAPSQNKTGDGNAGGKGISGTLQPRSMRRLFDILVSLGLNLYSVFLDIGSGTSR